MRLGIHLRSSSIKKYRIVTFTLAFLASTLIPILYNPTITHADTGGYPWSNATYVDANYDWGYTKCPDSAPGCMGISQTVGGIKYGEEDPYTMEFRNCTSYSAWKINAVGISQSFGGWGNASSWNSHAPSGSVKDPATYTPVAGDLAQWGTEVAMGAGHVAYVYAVNGSGVASLDEYNAAGTGEFSSNRTTASGSAGKPDHYIHLGSLPNPSPAHDDTIIPFGVQKVIEPDGTQQVYTSTDSDVWQTWWNSSGSATAPLLYISQKNITGNIEYDVGDGEQELYTATSAGIWETNWGNGATPASTYIIPNFSGVKKILFHSEVDSGVMTYQIYALTSSAVYQFWWNANSGGIQRSTIYSGTSLLDMAFGTSPSGGDEIFTATPGYVEESAFNGSGTITNTQIIGISQNDIGWIDKINSSSGTEILSTTIPSGDWDSNWTTGTPTYTQIVNNFSNPVAVKRRFDSAGNNQLYLANHGEVEQYWWGPRGSGAATLITVAQNNISSIDEDVYNGYTQLYTGAGHIAYEDYFGSTSRQDEVINTDTQIGNNNVL